MRLRSNSQRMLTCVRHGGFVVLIESHVGCAKLLKDLKKFGV